MKGWTDRHPGLWEFMLFNLLANCATVTNFVLMWLCTGFLFHSLKEYPFQLLVFDYTSSESLMLCGFLSFLTATCAAQAVNYIVQKRYVFRSDAAFTQAAPKYMIMAAALVVISAALPAYTQRLLTGAGVPVSLIPTLANGINILVQVVISYPTMKLWIMPGKKRAA